MVSNQNSTYSVQIYMSAGDPSDQRLSRKDSAQDFSLGIEIVTAGIVITLKHCQIKYQMFWPNQILEQNRNNHE